MIQRDDTSRMSNKHKKLKTFENDKTKLVHYQTILSYRYLFEKNFQ